MKEIKLLESWVDSVIENHLNQPKRMGTPMKAKADRPLPREIDIQYKAQRAHPELSPEQALSLYMSDELEQGEKIDKQQTKAISSMNSEINKVEHDEETIQNEILRLADLIRNSR